MKKLQRSALLDANILILAVSAKVGFSRLKTFSRVQMFVESDVPLLEKLLKDYSSVVTTSYVLAEASNLANKLTGKLRTDWYNALGQYAVLTSEAHVPTSSVGQMAEVERFGITDAALRRLAETHTIITLEFRLSGYLKGLGLNVINFNHLRSSGGL